LGDFSWEKWEDHGKISGENQERMGFLMVPFVLREHQPLENPIKSLVCHQSSRIYWENQPPIFEQNIGF